MITSRSLACSGAIWPKVATKTAAHCSTEGRAQHPMVRSGCGLSLSAKAAVGLRPRSWSKGATKFSSLAVLLCLLPCATLPPRAQSQSRNKDQTAPTASAPKVSGSWHGGAVRHLVEFPCVVSFRLALRSRPSERLAVELLLQGLSIRDVSSATGTQIHNDGKRQKTGDVADMPSFNRGQAL